MCSQLYLMPSLFRLTSQHLRLMECQAQHNADVEYPDAVAGTDEGAAFAGRTAAAGSPAAATTGAAATTTVLADAASTATTAATAAITAAACAKAQPAAGAAAAAVLSHRALSMLCRPRSTAGSSHACLLALCWCLQLICKIAQCSLTICMPLLLLQVLPRHDGRPEPHEAGRGSGSRCWRVRRGWQRSPRCCGASGSGATAAAR